MRDTLNIAVADSSFKENIPGKGHSESLWIHGSEPLKETQEQSVQGSRNEPENRSRDKLVLDIEEKYGLRLSYKEAKLSDLQDRIAQLERELQDKTNEVKQFRQLTEENKQLVDDCEVLSNLLYGSEEEEKPKDEEDDQNGNFDQKNLLLPCYPLKARRKASSLRLSRADLNLLLLDDDKKWKVLILGDSHARNMQSMLEDELGDDYAVSCSFKPNSPLNEILQDVDDLTSSLTSEDFFIVLGGMTGIDDIMPFESQVSQSCEKLREVSKRTNVFINEIPFRYDFRLTNYYIRIANTIIDRFISQQYSSRSLKMVSVKFKRNLHYTKHGLNLNNTGKKFLAHHLAQLIRNRTQQNSVLSI